MHKPILIIIAGPNGSGKTSITSKIIHHDEARLLFRLTDGKLKKQYVEVIPDWAISILP